MRTLPRLDRVRRWARLAVIALLAVVALSAFIRLSNDGTDCADWPRCYGERGARAAAAAGASSREGESTATAVARPAHRLAAVAALLCAVVALVVSLGRPHLVREAALAALLVALALALALLGARIGGTRVPAIALANLVGGFAMLAVALRLALAGGATLPSPRLRLLAAGTAALVLLQVAAGGMVSITHAGLSCLDWAGCNAAARDVPWSALDPAHRPLLTTAAPYNAEGALAQALHRGLALAVSLAVALLGVLACRAGRRRIGLLLLALLAAQVAAGMALTSGALPLAVALAHNVLAAALFALAVALL